MNMSFSVIFDALFCYAFFFYIFVFVYTPQVALFLINLKSSHTPLITFAVCLV